MSKPAFIRWNGKQTGQSRRATLRSGRMGYGKILATVTYWPDSPASIDEADRIFAATARRDGFKIVGSDRDEE